MSPYNVIHRGYGGAHFRYLIFYTDRILNNHSLSMIVCFVANDIKGLEDVYNENNERDGTPEEIAAENVVTDASKIFLVIKLGENTESPS